MNLFLYCSFHVKRKIRTMKQALLIFGILFSFSHLKAQQYPAELTFHKTVIKAGNKTLTETVTNQITIFNRTGEKYAAIAIYGNKLNKISNIEASLLDRQGRTIRKLKKNEIKQRSEFSSSTFYDDAYVLEFMLKHNEYPYVISYSYQKQSSQFILLEDWIPVLSSSIPTRQAILEIRTPINYKIRTSEQKIRKMSTDTVNGQIIYQWITDYTNLIQPEIYSPPITEFLPRVSVFPLQFKYVIEGAQDNWENFGNWLYRLSANCSDLPVQQQEETRIRVKNISDDREKIRVLYHRLQDQTRYVNISLKAGGLLPYPASYVCTNKYGDCKALSFYFKTILESIGIQAYYTLVYAGNPIPGFDTTPSPGLHFNHVILYIPLPQDTLWLDCTSKQAFGYLGTFTQNRLAFIVDKDNSRLIRTPALRPEDVTLSRSLRIAQTTGSSASVQLSNRYKGNGFEYFSTLDKAVDANTKDHAVRYKLSGNYFNILSYKIHDQGRDADSIYITAEGSSEKLISLYGDELILRIPRYELPDFEAPGKRKTPVQIDHPIHTVDSIQILIPEGYGLSDSIPVCVIETPFGIYCQSVGQTDSLLNIRQETCVFAGKYPLSLYADFHAFIQLITKQNQTKYITFQKTHKP